MHHEWVLLRACLGDLPWQALVSTHSLDSF